MDAMIKLEDKRYYAGFRIAHLHDTTYEAIAEYLKVHKKAFSISLSRSHKHENSSGGAFFTREQYLEFMRNEIQKGGS